MLTLNKVIDDIAKETKLLKSPYENMTDLTYTVRSIKKEYVEEKLCRKISDSDMTVIRLILVWRIKGGD